MEYEQRPFENLREGGYSDQKHVAEDLVESGECVDYDEAYAVIKGMRSGDRIRTFRGWFRKQ